MIVRIEKRQVDVLDARCAGRECYQLGFDKGSFVVGRGYTSSGPAKERAVCQTRHLHGCPVGSVCPTCRTASVDPPGARCGWSGCGVVTVERVVAADAREALEGER